MGHDVSRTRLARVAAESALLRVVHHYGGRPEFVVLGGLVPELLCTGSRLQHAGTTDVDVQVDLEIAAGAVNTARLERALRNAEFAPEKATVWRWTDAGVPGEMSRTVVKFELLADLDYAPAERVVHFKECQDLGAVNLRGTGFTARDVVVRTLTGRVDDDLQTVEVNVAGLAGFLLAKTAAAHARRAPKDWYDVAFVLINNDDGGPEAAAHVVRQKFHSDLVGPVRTALEELRANFADSKAQGPQAYVNQVLTDHPELDPSLLAADAVLAVDTFYRSMLRP